MAPVSLFDSTITNDTLGVAWLALTDPEGDTQLIDGRDSDRRATEQIDTDYIVNAAEAYVSFLHFRGDGTLRLRTHSNPNDIGLPAGPQLTDDAEENLGLAVRLIYADTNNANHHRTAKWRLDLLVNSDTDEPYEFSSASVDAAGDANTAELRSAMRNATSVQSILVDRTHSNIDWDNLTTADLTLSAPDAVTSVSVTGDHNSRLIEWFLPTSGDPIDNIRVFVWKPSNPVWVNLSGNLSPTATSYTDGADLTISETIFYQVQTSNAGGSTNSGNTTFVVTIPPTDLTPTAPNIGNQVATVGTYYSQTLAAGSGGDGTLTYSVSGLPPGLTFNSSSRVISGNPTSAGTYIVTYTVTDADGDDDDDTFNIVVSAAPVIDLMPTAPNIGNQVATVGTYYSQTLAAGSGGDGTLAYSVSGLPPGLTFSTGSRVISGFPTAAGTYNVTYTVTDDDGDEDDDTFNIVVSASDLFPSAPNISNRTATVGTAYSQTLPIGTGGDAPLSYTATGLPPGLTFSTSTRVISGTPTSAGTYTVTYTVTDDDGDDDDENFNIVVSAAPVMDLMPTAPNISNRTATVGTAYSQTLPIGTGGDAPLSYTATGLPPGLTFTASTRVIAGTPTTAGTYTVTYTVTDDDGDEDDDTFNIVVSAAPVIDGISLWDEEAFHNSTLGVAWLALTDPEGDTQLIDGRDSDRRATEQIDTDYIVNAAEAYVSFLHFRGDGTLRLRTHSNPNDIGLPAGPQLTDDAEENLGLAVRLIYADTNNANHHRTAKWRLDLLVNSDTDEPYEFSSASVDAAGDANTAELRSAMRNATSIQSILVDRTHSNIDWDNLTALVGGSAAPTTYNLRGSNTVPAPTAAARVGYEAPTPALTLADFVVPAGQVEVDAALITSGRNGQDWLYYPDISVGTLEDGTLEPEPGYEISRIRDRNANDFQLNDNPDAANIETFFDTGAGADLTIHIQDADGVASIVATDTLSASSNANNARFATTGAFDTIVSRIADGDLFIIAFTRAEAAPTYRLRGAATVPAPSAAGRVGYAEPAQTLYNLRGSNTVPAPSAAGRIGYAESVTGISLWDEEAFLNSTLGVAWLALTDPEGDTELIDGRDSDRRATEQIDTDYIVNAAEAYVSFLHFRGDGTLRLRTHSNPNDIGLPAGPQLTDDAEANLGLAIRLIYTDTSNANHHRIAKWRLDLLVDSDTDEPYEFSSASVDNAGDENTADLRSAMRNATSIQSILVDRTHSNIDWDNLTALVGGSTTYNLRGSNTVPAPSAAGRVSYSAGSLGISLWDAAAFLDSTLGVLTLGTVTPNASGTQIIVASVPTQQLDEPIDPEYIVGGATSYWTFLQFLTTGRIQFFTHPTNDNVGAGAGPQFTEAAEDSIGFALRLIYADTTDSDHHRVIKYPFDVLGDSDESEPYTFSAASVTAAGETNDASLRSSMGGAASIQVILVDRDHSNINWDNLTALVGGAAAANTYRLRGSVAVPAPSAAGRIGYAESVAGLSLWDAEAFLNSTLGVAWLATTTNPQEFGSGITWVDGRSSDRRASEQIDTEFIVNGATAFVTNMDMRTTGILTLRLHNTDDDLGSDPGPQLTDEAEAGLGWAIRLIYSDTTNVNHGRIAKWRLDLLVLSDPDEPYAFSSASVDAAGDANTTDLRNAIRDATSVQSLLVDRTHSNIDWDNLTALVGGSAAANTYRLRGSVAVPAPGAAGRIGYADSVTVVPLAVQDAAEILPALSASIDGAARWPGGLMAEVESYRASMFGGPDAATLNVTGPEAGLRWLLTQLRRPVHVNGRQAGMVWWGYAHRVELRLGAILITVSLDGYRSAIAVQYLRDGRDLGLRSGFHVEQPAASQYGQIELLGAQELMEPTAEQLAALLDPYLKIARGVEVSRQPATGARVYCRGWSAALEWRHVPRYHENASYGDILDFRDSRGEYGGLPSGLSIGSSTEVEYAIWLDFDKNAPGHPDFEMYMSSTRLRLSGPDANAGSGYSDDRYASIWQRARTTTGNPTTADPPAGRIGDEIEFSASGLPRFPNPTPSPPPYPRDVTKLIELDFSGQDVLLPEAGFFVVIRGTLTGNQRRGAFGSDPSASWSWARTGGSGAWTPRTEDRRPLFDFFTRCRGQGLLRLLLDGHDILSAGPAPGDVGERSYAVYLEGVSTVAHHVQQVQDVEQLAYVIDPARGVHFFGSGQRTFEMGRNGIWRTPVARGSMAFLGQNVTATGERAICEHAVFTPRTGLWDLSFRALPTAGELASARRSTQRIARQGP